MRRRFPGRNGRGGSGNDTTPTARSCRARTFADARPPRSARRLNTWGRSAKRAYRHEAHGTFRGGKGATKGGGRARGELLGERGARPGGVVGGGGRSGRSRVRLRPTAVVRFGGKCRSRF